MTPLTVVELMMTFERVLCGTIIRLCVVCRVFVAAWECSDR